MNKEKESELQEYVTEVKYCKRELLKIRICRILIVPIVYFVFFIMVIIIPVVGMTRIVTNIIELLILFWIYFYIITCMFKYNKDNKIIKFINNYSSSNYNSNVRFFKNCIRRDNIYIKALKEGRELTSSECIDVKIDCYYS